MNKPVHKAEYGRKSNRKIVLLCLLLVCILIVGGIASMNAYFIDMKTSSNTFTVGEVVIELTETAGGVCVFNGSEETDTSRNVDCYVRVFAEPERPDAGAVTGMSSKWTKIGDYYYYDEILGPGNTTEPITTDRTGLIIYAEAIQAESIVGEGEGAYEAFQNAGN